MKRILLLISVIFCCTTSGWSQLNIQMDTSFGFVGLNDTVLMNSTHLVTVYFENVGNSPIDEVVTFYMAVEDSFGVLGQPFIVDSVDYTGFNLPVGFTDTATFPLTISQSYYYLGGNTTVIWPLAPTFTGDTLSTDVHIVLNQSIQGTGGNKQYPDLIIYPNPAKDQLKLNYEGFERDIEQVRIIALDGRVIYRGALKNTISVQGYDSGTYIFEVQFSDGSLRRSRFMVVH